MRQIFFFSILYVGKQTQKLINLLQATQLIRVREEIQTQVFQICSMCAISVLTGYTLVWNEIPTKGRFKFVISSL